MSVTFALTSIDTCIVNKNPTYGKNWWLERINQYSNETADGGETVYDGGPSILKGEITFLNVLKSEGDAFRTFITDNLVYRKNTCDITPPTNTDFGNGDGVAVEDVRYNGPSSLDGLFTYHSPGLYDIVFPYRGIEA